MDIKKKIKSCLVAILSFVMVFTSMPLVSHADDQSAGEDVTGQEQYRVEWVFVVVDERPMLRMHLQFTDSYGETYDFWGNGCRSGANIRSRNAAYRNMTGGRESDTLVNWLDRLEASGNFSNISLLHYSLLDFNYPLQNNFDWNYSDCYAVWTAEIDSLMILATPGQQSYNIRTRFL